MTRDELISCKRSILSKVFDRTMHKQVAYMSVEIAYNILNKIDDTYQFSNSSKTSD